MTGSQSSGDQEHIIKARRREDYAPEEWARLAEHPQGQGAVGKAGNARILEGRATVRSKLVAGEADPRHSFQVGKTIRGKSPVYPS